MFGSKNAGFMETLLRRREHRREAKSMKASAIAFQPNARIPLERLVRRETYFAEAGCFRWNR